MTDRAQAPSDLYVVLATRGIALSKARLAGVLTPRERAALNRWLIERTLEVIAAWLQVMDRCIVVSACADALALAAKSGARALDEPGGALGHNHAARVGAAHAVCLRARKIMFLPADLPYLTPAALDEFAGCATRADLVLAPDKDGPGTNALIVEAVPDTRFYFGPGSLARYVRWGCARGWRIALHAAPQLAFDLDTPDDYARWASRQREGACPDRGRDTSSAML